MFITLKIIHMLCIFGGGGAMIGNGVLLARIMASGEPPSDLVKGAMKTIGMIGLVSIVLLWVTGVWMVASGNYEADLAYMLKMIAAGVVLVLVLAMNYFAAAAAKAGTPPNMARTKLLSRTAAACAFLAAALAVITFN